jgi:large subunit ribosomal protein L10
MRDLLSPSSHWPEIFVGCRDDRIEGVKAMGVREEKVAFVAEVADKLGRSRSTIVTDYRGLTVAEITELRKNLRAAGIEYRVMKNTLTRRATAQSNTQVLDVYLEGPTAVAFSYDDAVAPAKVLNDFAGTHKALEIKGGLVEGKLVDADGVKELASLPSREGLLSMLLSVLQAPVRNLAYAVNQVAEKSGVQA